MHDDLRATSLQETLWWIGSVRTLGRILLPYKITYRIHLVVVEVVYPVTTIRWGHELYIRPDMSYIFSKSGRNRDPDNPVKRAIMCVPGPLLRRSTQLSDPTIPQLCGLLQVRACICARRQELVWERHHRPAGSSSPASIVACAHADAAFASCPPWSRRVAFSSCPISSFRPHAYGSCCRAALFLRASSRAIRPKDPISF